MVWPIILGGCEALWGSVPQFKGEPGASHLKGKSGFRQCGGACRLFWVTDVPPGEEVARKAQRARRSFAREVDHDDFGAVTRRDQEALAVDCYWRRDPIDLDLRSLDGVQPARVRRAGDALGADDRIVCADADGNLAGGPSGT